MITKKNIGRPSKFTQKSFAKILDKYLLERKSEDSKGIITILDFCVYAGVTREYLSDHSSRDKKGTESDFSDTIKRLRLEAEASLEINALKGKISIPMAIFCLKNNHWWSDKREEPIEPKEVQRFYMGLPRSQFFKPDKLPPWQVHDESIIFDGEEQVINK
jgi:hypothetical protein